MHKSMVVAASLLFVGASAFAQQASRSNSVYVFVTELSQSNIGGAKIDAEAYGASFDHMFTERLSGDLSVTSQRSRRYLRTFTSSEPTSVLVAYRLYPIDVNISYHFPSGNRWKPYLGAGLRYVNDTFHGYQGSSRTAFYRPAVRTIDPEVSGGITWQFSRTLGLRLDAKQVLGSHRSDVADPEFKASAGLSVCF